MYVLGITIAGVFIGAVGAEILRYVKPDLLAKIEQMVKSFVNPEPPAGERKGGGSKKEQPS